MDSKYNLGLLMKFDIFKRFFSLLRKKKKLPLTKEEVDAIHQQIFIHNQSFPAMPLSDLTLWVKPFRRPKYMYLKKLLRFSDSLEQANVIASWGLGRKTLDLFDIAKKTKKPLLLLEDGFIRSLYTWPADADPELRAGISFCFDKKGMYYDGMIATDLEDLLNSEIITEAQCQQARKYIDLIVKNKISKYNSQPLSSERLKKENQKRILVVDQSYGDMSLICGGVTDSVFERMISDAVKENPNAEILFKIHPDTLARNTESGFQKLIPEQVRIIDWPINPITMLEAVDEVYVATSQLGFEALMCGKKVHVYGLPFYAGWGLTNDKVPCPRRKRKLSIEELFYIVYLKYVHYFDPVQNKEGSIEDAIEYILQCRKKLLGQ